MSRTSPHSSRHELLSLTDHSTDESTAPIQPRKWIVEARISLLYVLKTIWNWPWIWEFLACCLSVGGMAAIVALLVAFDKAEASMSLPFNLILPSTISVLTTAINGAMVVPLASGLSQIMWNRLRLQPRPLSEMTFLDNASRDIVTGGIALLWRRRGGPLSCLALAIGLASLAFGPLTQNSLVLRSLDGTATLPRCLTTKSSVDAQSELNSQFIATVFSGEADSVPAIQNQALQHLSKDCGTDNCTWPSYSFISICSNVTNITAAVTKTGNNGYVLPNGLGVIVGSQMYSTPLAVSASLETEDYESWGGSLIANISLFALNMTESWGEPETPDNYIAWEVIFYWCIQTYNSAVSNNVLDQNVTKSWYDRDAKGDSVTGVVLTPPETFWNDLGLESSTSFTLDGSTFNPDYIGYAFDTNLSATFPYPVLDFTISNKDLWDLQGYFPKLADAMTHRLRYAVCKDTVVGIQYGIKTVFNVQYAWLTLPCVTAAMTTFFSLCVLKFHSPPGMVWKSSIAATLFHGLDADIRTPREMEQVLDVREMGMIAEEVYVRLDDVEQDGDRPRRFRLQNVAKTGESS